jgi:plastocyanin domain-containing protein
MDTSQIVVTAAGAAAGAWVVWFFFLSERKQFRAQAAAGGAQRVRVVVKGGYEPDVIVAEKGRPLTLDFYRDEATGCSDTVVFGDFGISRPLPPYRTTSIELTPDRAGEFPFTCGMNMLRGKLIVKELPAGTGSRTDMK